MLFRKCAGGVVFYNDTVFLLRNDKEEWVLPKGVIRGGALRQDVAVERVKSETGVDATVLEAVGETNYEFYSVSRRTPVNNRVMWYTMQASSDAFHVAKEQGFTDGGWFSLTVATDLITYTQDKSLLRLAHEKYVTRLAEGVSE